MNGLLEYVPGDSPLHRLDPRSKLLFALFVCVACFACDSLYILTALVLLGLAAGALGEIFPSALRLLGGLLRFSALLFVLQLLFTNQGNVLLELPLGISVTSGGLISAAQVTLRLVGATLMLSLMLSLIQPSALSAALVSRCRIPYKYAFAVVSAIRFVPTLAQQMKDVIEAQTARGVNLDTRNIFKKLGLVAPLCVPLLISSVRGIDSSAIAAELRGFNLRGAHSAWRVPCFRAGDYATLLFGGCLIATGVLF